MLNGKQLTHGGETMTILKWSRRVSIDRNTIATRIRMGWPVDKALTTTPRTVHRKRQVVKCPKGHPYDAANTILKKRGKYTLRHCRTCENERSRKYHEKHREKILARKAAYREAKRQKK